MTSVQHGAGSEERTLGSPAWMRLALRRLGVSNPPYKEVVHERNLPVTMSDGCVLLADRWSPRGTEDAPLILVRIPYGRRQANGLLMGRVLAHHGFQVLIQSCRGTQDSGGTFDRPFAAERADGRDTVSWLRRQAWYPGQFATAGGSYVGYTQLAVAAEAGDELAAAVWTAAPTSTRDIVWPDDTFAIGSALAWTAQVTDDPTAGVKHLLRIRGNRKRLEKAARSAPLTKSYTIATGEPVPFFESWLLGEKPGASVWQDQDLSEALERVSCPVLIQTGWYDVFLDASLHQYQRLRERGVDARLTVGPWHHVQMALPSVPDMVQFLTEVLRDGPSRHGRVALTQVGSETVELLQGWPVHDLQTRTFHLVGGRLSEDLPRSDVGPEATQFLYDPADPTPQRGGAILDPMQAGPRDNRALESRPDVVVFDSEPLWMPLRLLGSPRVRVVVGSDRPATCIFVRLCDVGADGRSTNLSDRMVPLRADARDEHGRWHLDVELSAIAATVAAGHRIRLQVSSGAFPRFARHPGTEEPVATAEQFVPARQTIHHSLALPGALTLPVRPVG